MDREAAEEYTDSLGQIFAGSWRQVLWAREQGIPQALGLSVDEWVRVRLGGHVKLSIPERREAVKELTAPVEEGGKGLTTREAAEVLGVSHPTVVRDTRDGSNEPSEPEPPTDRAPADGSNEPDEEEGGGGVDAALQSGIESVTSDWKASKEQAEAEELPPSPQGFEFAERQKETEEEKAYHNLVHVTLWAKLDAEEVAAVCPNPDIYLNTFEPFETWVARFVEALRARRSRPLRAVK